MATLLEWLQARGLERYVEALIAADIDLDILPDLDDADLAAAGLPVGARKRLLQAIRETHQSSPPVAGADEVAEAVAPSTPIAAAPRGAERRQLTIVFCDIAGWTDLSSRIDPEDLRAVMGAYQDACAEAVRRYDGTVAKFLGDGVLACFGYPHAHEDDAERAVLAAQAILEAVAAIDSHGGAKLAARAGIASGLTVVGDLIGVSAREEGALSGEATNLAARLQAVTEPGSVLVSVATWQRLRGAFEGVERSDLRLKGIAGPVSAWRIGRPRRSASRYEAARGIDHVDSLGRDSEIALMLDRWREAVAGEGQAVFLTGEAGIGKSNVCAALRQRLAGEPHASLTLQCSPYHIASALYPVARHLEHVAGIEAADAPAARIDRLAAHLGLAPDGEPMALIASLLAIEGDPRVSALTMAPERQRARSLEILADLLLRPAGAMPLLLVLEDAHWIDPTTHELLRRAIDQARALPVLFLITARPETQLQWPAQAPITSLSLSRLRRQACIALIERIVAAHPLPADLVERIVERADGVPLFAEELTLMLMESGRAAAAATGIPETLHDSLMARLDRLPGARAIAQAGAAIGREFEFALLARAINIDRLALERGLRELERAELLFRNGEPPQARYTFKHALVQDAAYGSLVKSRRAELHRRVLAALQERGDVLPQVLARHAQEAGEAELAVTLWRQGAENNLRRGAALEAADYFRRALAVLGTLPEGPERLSLEQSIYTRLGVAQMGTASWGSDEIFATFDRACVLGRQLGQPATMVPALIGAWVSRFHAGHFDAAQKVTDELFDVAQRTGDDNFLLQAHHAAWPLLWRRGRLAEADAHVEAGMACYDEHRHADHRHVYLGHDPGLCASVVGSILAWGRGRFGESLARAALAAQMAERLDHLQSSVLALWMAAEAQCHRQDAGAALQSATQLRELCERNGVNMQLIYAISMQNWAEAMAGEPIQVSRIRTTVERLRDNRGATQPQHYAFAAEACLRCGALDDAAALVGEAHDIVRRRGELWTLPMLEGLAARLALARGNDRTAAQAHLDRGMAVARDGGGLAWELRLGLDLARLYGEDGRREEAQRVLKPILDRLTGEDGNRDLDAARTLFVQL